MNFDRNSLKKLLALNDDELAKVISEIALEAGVNPSSFSVKKADLAKVRTLLSMASDKEISDLLTQFGGKNNGNR